MQVLGMGQDWQQQRGGGGPGHVYGGLNNLRTRRRPADDRSFRGDIIIPPQRSWGCLRRGRGRRATRAGASEGREARTLCRCFSSASAVGFILPFHLVREKSPRCECGAASSRTRTYPPRPSPGGTTPCLAEPLRTMLTRRIPVRRCVFALEYALASRVRRCFKCKCSGCGKFTWQGCGMHISSALAGVPEADRCAGWQTGQCQPVAVEGHHSPSMPKPDATKDQGPRFMKCFQ